MGKICYKVGVKVVYRPQLLQQIPTDILSERKKMASSFFSILHLTCHLPILERNLFRESCVKDLEPL